MTSAMLSLATMPEISSISRRSSMTCGTPVANLLNSDVGATFKSGIVAEVKRLGLLFVVNDYAPL